MGEHSLLDHVKPKTCLVLWIQVPRGNIIQCFKNRFQNDTSLQDNFETVFTIKSSSIQHLSHHDSFFSCIFYGSFEIAIIHQDCCLRLRLDTHHDRVFLHLNHYQNHPNKIIPLGSHSLGYFLYCYLQSRIKISDVHLLHRRFPWFEHTLLLPVAK